MKPQYVKLLVLNGFLLAFLVAVALFDWQPIRVVLGLASLFFIPGYVILLALLPDSGKLDELDRLGLSIPLSMAFATIVGLALATSPLGLNFASLVTSMSLGVMILSGIAVSHNEKTQKFKPASPRRLQKNSKLQKASVMISAIVVIAWVWFSTLPAPQGEYSEFYLLDSDGSTSNYPSELTVNIPLPLDLVIANKERKEQTYWVKAVLGGQELGLRGPIKLGSHEEWVGFVTVIALETGEERNEWQRLSIWLFKDNTDGSPHLRTSLWVHVVEDMSGN